MKVRLLCEHESREAADTRPATGMDMGIKSRITLSNGYQEPKRSIDRTTLKQKQRTLSQVIGESNNRPAAFPASMDGMFRTVLQTGPCR